MISNIRMNTYFLLFLSVIYISLCSRMECRGASVMILIHLENALLYMAIMLLENTDSQDQIHVSFIQLNSPSFQIIY